MVLMMKFKWMVAMLVQISLTTSSGELLSNQSVKFDSRKPNPGSIHAIKTIQSEDGDIIDCIDIYKQPAFDHPALRNHKIQLKPSHDIEKDPTEPILKSKKTSATVIEAKQVWQKSGTCPEGAIPIRRNTKSTGRKGHKINKYEMRKVKNVNSDQEPNEHVMLLRPNHSLAILHAEGFAYYGVQAVMKVFNPSVERDDEYSKTLVGLESGFRTAFSSIQSGWLVHPSVYGDRQTRLFVYWTYDGGKETGCYDLFCPGFVQTSHEIALGAALYPIPNSLKLPTVITLLIHYDRDTKNYWLRYGDNTEIGYWPADLFPGHMHNFGTAQWGGDVYSSRVGVSPHTATQMGSGRWPDYFFGMSGHMWNIWILGNEFVPRIPEFLYTYLDEEWPKQCYKIKMLRDYSPDPDLYYGGPGRSAFCP